MRWSSQVLLLTMLAAPPASIAQSAVVAEGPPELSLILDPGPLVGGLPQAFTFHLRNIGQTNLSIPEPNVDCGNATTSGSVSLNESWQPATGNDLGTGLGVCKFGGPYLRSDAQCA